MRLEFSRWVESDLETLGDYIAAGSPRRALSFIQEIRQKLNEIARQPHLYQLRPEIGDQARMAVHGRYVILFRILEDAVRIERVVYGGRDLPPIFRA